MARCALFEINEHGRIGLIAFLRVDRALVCRWYYISYLVIASCSKMKGLGKAAAMVF